MDQALNGHSAPENQTLACDGLESHRTLERLRSSWQRRAQVRRGDLHENHLFDLSQPDFLVELLPFQDHPHIGQLTDIELQRVLTSGWLIYNAKTLDIENHIVSPLCLDVMTGNFPGMADQLSQQLICETMVDESYHVLLTLNACEVTRQMRQIEVTVPSSTLVRRMQAFEAEYSELWQKKLIRFATCVISEIFVSDYRLVLTKWNTYVWPEKLRSVSMHCTAGFTHKGRAMFFPSLNPCLLSRRSYQVWMGARCPSLTVTRSTCVAQFQQSSRKFRA